MKYDYRLLEMPTSNQTLSTSGTWAIKKQPVFNSTDEFKQVASPPLANNLKSEIYLGTLVRCFL
jgi:hypothetical protein